MINRNVNHNVKDPMKHTLEVDSVILEFREKRALQNVYLKCETGKIHHFPYLCPDRKDLRFTKMIYE